MPAIAPGLAAGDARNRQAAAGERAVLRQGLQSVGRAGRGKSATIAKPGTQQQPVGLDQCDQQCFHADNPALAKSCTSSSRTTALSASEVALGNVALSNPAASRTTYAAGGALKL